VPSVEEYCRLLDKVKADYTGNITRIQAKRKLQRFLAKGFYPKTYTKREKEILKQVGYPPEIPENVKGEGGGILTKFKQVINNKEKIPRKELVKMFTDLYGQMSYMHIMNLIARAKKGEETFGFKLTERKKILYKKKLGRMHKSKNR